MCGVIRRNRYSPIFFVDVSLYNSFPGSVWYRQCKNRHPIRNSGTSLLLCGGLVPLFTHTIACAVQLWTSLAKLIVLTCDPGVVSSHSHSLPSHGFHNDGLSSQLYMSLGLASRAQHRSCRVAPSSSEPRFLQSAFTNLGHNAAMNVTICSCMIGPQP